jgi:hypothetical protein
MGKANKERLNKMLFRWSRATKEEKLDRLKYIYEKHVIRNENCWGWNGKLHKGGYAVMIFGEEHKQIGAHRVSYMIHKGEIPIKTLVCHTCDNRSCTNPEHLFLGTHKDNTQDMIKKGRENRLKGSKNKSSRLSEKDVENIRKMLDAKVKLTLIAELYKVHISTISDIKLKKTWKHTA